MSENLFPLLKKMLKDSSKQKQTKMLEERRSATLDICEIGFVKRKTKQENMKECHCQKDVCTSTFFICEKSYGYEYQPTSLRVI